ncbi:hypothetical protein [Clostridium pasteurianum]|uniref:Phage protein, HK97 gp10 family n=1 Tax=Clostridium pasteurianum BC1 TaxID=86416 RepID=R4K0W0_CLOPA|nr:hypothetical protein [Clostridium pasteurianum]AGK95406.1 hypothetical protein Clopa_0344 [Clostridium pasteurianum BC1]
MSTVNIDQMADEILKGLEDYTREITGEVKKVVDIVAKETNEEIKKHIAFNQHSGKYVKAFRIKNAYEDGYKKVNVWYVAGGQHRLTHLLENGHALWQGGRTRAFPHIKYGEELAKKRMEELAKEAIENAGR